MEAYNISLQIGSKTISAGPLMQEILEEAVRMHNAGILVAGLDPELCPGCLSESRIFALLERLPDLDTAVLETLRGKSINLAFAKLYLSDAYPVEAAAIAQCKLEVKPSNSPIARPVMLVPFEAPAAIRLVEKARTATQDYDAKVKAIQQDPALATETDGALKYQLKAAEVARFYAATVWHRNADLLAHELKLVAWSAEAETAKAAMAAYQVLVGAAMPLN